MCTDEAYPDDIISIFFISPRLIQLWVITANTLFKKVIFLFVTTLRIIAYGNIAYTNYQQLLFHN